MLRKLFTGGKNSAGKIASKKRRRPAIERLEDKNLLAADLTLNVTDGGATAAAGETVVYEFEFANIGDEAADGKLRARLSRGAIIDADASDAAWECKESHRGGGFCELELGELAADAAGTVALAVTVDADISPYQSEIYAEGRIYGDDIRRDGNDSDWAVTPIDRKLHDLSVTIDDGDAVIMPGDTVTYTVDYANNGTNDATGAKVSIRLPRDTTLNAEASSEGWACEGIQCTLELGDVAAGETGSATYAVTLDADSNARRVRVFASVEADGIDAYRHNNRDHDSTDVVQQVPDLAITVGDGGVAVVAGETVEYTFSYTNKGVADSTGAEITFKIPRGTSVAEDTGDWACEGRTCTLAVGDLAAGAERTATLSVVVDEDLSERKSYVRGSAHISDDGSAGYDANRRDNYARISTKISRNLPDLGVTLSAGDAEIKTGDTISYTLDYVNNGNVDSTGVSVKFYLGGATASVEGTDWSCEGRVCSVAIGDVAAGGSGTVTLNATVDSSRRVMAFAKIRDDGENGRDDNRRDNYAMLRTSVVEVEVEEEEEGEGEGTEGGGETGTEGGGETETAPA